MSVISGNPAGPIKHSFGLSAPAILPVPELSTTKIIGESSAVAICDRLKQIVDQFMTSLAPKEELGLALSSFGVSHVISVMSFKAVGPCLIAITGYENGKQVTLVQHVSQLSFLLVPVLLSQPDAAPRRTIGFQTE